MVKKISDNDITELNNAEFALLDISATWCGPCKFVAPIVEDLSEEFEGQVEFFNADSDENPELAKNLKVMSIPWLGIFQKGELISKQVGAQPAEVLHDWIEETIAQ